MGAGVGLGGRGRKAKWGVQKREVGRRAMVGSFLSRQG